MTVSVMITTKNRIVDLRRTCRALQRLNPPPLEVLITMDGCKDEIVEAVRAELPQARLFVNKTGLGSVASRDRMMREARGDLVLALDDDSYPEQSDCVARIVPLFEQRPELAVLHFPQRTDEYPETLAQTNFGSEHLTRSFANSGAVLRRSAYLQLPAFPVCTWHPYLARFLPVSLCLQTRLVLGDSRTHLVVSGTGWNSVLSSKAQACFVGGLQTLAGFAVEDVPESWLSVRLL